MLTDLTLVQARDGLRRKDFTAVELTDAHLAVVDALNLRLNALITVMADSARAAAGAADVALASGDERPLLGLPLAIKDLFCTAGTRTTAGSRILSPFVPPYESTVTANLLRD
ncbi:MAG TPA: amidase family protein, partial [Acetobacteraceae bacterium]